MCKKITLLMAALSIALAASCGVFLGPISELSMEQRMNKGWKLIYEFSDSMTAIYPTMSYSKLLITKMNNEIRGLYLSGGGGNSYLYYFTTNSHGNFIFMHGTYMPNQIDVSYDISNSSLVSWEGAIQYYYNDLNTPWSQPYISNMTEILVADTNVLVGSSLSNYTDTLVKTVFNSVSSTEFVLPANSIMNIAKCRNKYNGDTVIYAQYQDMYTYYYMLELIGLNSFNSSMLNTAFQLTNYTTPILESDGNNRLFMVLEKNIYSYNSGSKSFVYENSFSQSIAAGSPTGICTADFVGDSLMIMNYESSNSNAPANIFFYNTSTKACSEIDVFDPQTNMGYIIGLDMYHDKTTGAIYVGVVYYESMSMTLNVKLYMNQM